MDKSFGFLYLDAANLGAAKLSHKDSREVFEIGDEADVFLYEDSKSELRATTKSVPTVGQIAYLPLKSMTEIGAFMDWGLDKDLYVPLAEQHRPFEDDKSYLVYLYLDKVNGRITASSKINKFITDFPDADEYKVGQEVHLIIGNTTDIGFKAVINNIHWGVLYNNEVFQQLSFGQSLKGYIKNIREDRRIDLILQQPLHKALDQNASMIETYLNDNNGFAPFNDKSNPAAIKSTFGISKAVFKKSLGSLYKNKIIVIKDDGIYLTSKIS